MSRERNKTKNASSRVRVVPAAGAVLYRMEGDSPLIAVVHRPRYDDWSLPKGKVDPGESLPVTAVRELIEETGFNSILESLIGTTGYPLSGNARKEVTYWSAAARDGRFEPNSEVDELQWLPADEASELVSYALDRKILRRYEAAATADSVLMLVRHAKAGSRSAWSGNDDLRPLEKTGRTQAEMLAPMLRSFGVDRLYSAPRVRCEQTLSPLADELGVKIGTETVLSDDAYQEAPETALERLRDIAAGPGVAAICSQGSAIPGIVGDLAAEAGVDVGETSTKKAGTWALGLRGGTLAYADYYPSPLPVH